MAGVKVTDLTTLGAAASDDVMYIVDTSSNQSKQIEVQHLYVGMPQFDSGTYTPVASDEIDCSIPLIYNAFYSRVNDIVTMTITFEYQLINGQTTGSFNISLPVSSNFTNAKDVSGIIQAMSGANINAITAATISADTTNDLITIGITCPNADDNVQYVCANIQYLIA